MKDFGCGDHTYDGHTGNDCDIRSFREVKIGVPVYAALDGRVLSIQHGVGGDFNWGPTVSHFDNHIILDHGDEHHIRLRASPGKSITVKKGQWVAAGTQIGLTASSGNSSWPHLHFTDPPALRADPGAVRGRQCGTTSGWARQPAVTARLSRQRHSQREALRRAADLPYDEAVRTGTFVRGCRYVNVRVEVRNVAADGPGG